MAVIDKISVPDRKNIETQAVTALISQLGPARAAFFLRDHLAGPTDYLKWKENAFGREDVTSLVKQIEADRIP